MNTAQAERTLGLTPPYTQKDIRAAIRRARAQYHPDVNPTDDARAIWQLINQCEEVLVDAKSPEQLDLQNDINSAFAQVCEDSYRQLIENRRKQKEYQIGCIKAGRAIDPRSSFGPLTLGQLTPYILAEFNGKFKGWNEDIARTRKRIDDQKELLTSLEGEPPHTEMAKLMISQIHAKIESNESGIKGIERQILIMEHVQYKVIEHHNAARGVTRPAAYIPNNNQNPMRAGANYGE